MTADRKPGPGRPEPLGVTLTEGGANVAVWSAAASAVWFCLFDQTGRHETARIRLPARTGDVHHGWISGLSAGDRYGLRADGPYDAVAGQMLNPAKLLVDPYAAVLDRPFLLEPALFDGHTRHAPRDDVDSAGVVPKAIVAAEPDEIAPWNDRPRSDQRVIYELNVRAFTRRHPAVADALQGTLAGLVEAAPLDHLRQLGVTTVELMPLAAWIDERHLPALGLTNAWGYNPVVLGAPDPRVAPGGWDEVRMATGRLHAAGFEVILDVVLNHTGESDRFGPTLSLRGLDNAAYYRLDGGAYVNDTGCGNTLALDRPHAVRLVMDMLRRWVTWGGVDGFRFDLATVMGRTATGFDPAAPLLTAISQDPVLRGSVLIAEPWDLGPGGYRLGGFPAGWLEWNDRYRDGVRRFWRGDAGTLGELATRLAGSADTFGRERPSRSVNFVTAHDGFTLRDLVSFRTKRNQANGEENRDGRDESFSWNHGIEGPTSDPGVLARRRRDERNLLATLLLSRGTPMLAMGSELGHSQGGNNNAYAQDNATTWIDWAGADRCLATFTSRLVALRKAHPALHSDSFLTGHGTSDGGPADVTWLTEHGQPMTEADWHDATRRTVVVRLFRPATVEMPEDGVLLAINGHEHRFEVRLPRPRPGHRWMRILDTAEAEEQPARIETDQAAVDGRAIVVFVEHADAGRSRAGPDDAEIDRLAEAAGIAPDWWEISGTYHRVGLDTKRALLAAMGHPTGTRGDVAAAREDLARLTDRRRLPMVAVGHPGEPILFDLPAADPLPAWVEVVDEEGLRKVVSLSLVAGGGRHAGRQTVRLPPLPIGRYRLADPETGVACHLIVAPRRCWLPGDLAAAGRAFGISAQLYGVRRPGDQGIGDLTTLAGLARQAAAVGARTVGVNPLHALFATDRTRASPYYPSDRRTLDPLYIDVAALVTALGSERGAQRLADQRATIEDLARQALIDYPAVAQAKTQVLWAVFREFETRASDPRHGELRTFAEEGQAPLADFAHFEALSGTRAGLPWTMWDESLRTPAAARGRVLPPDGEERRRFAIFCQWAADRQLAEAAAVAQSAGLDLGLYRDLAVGAAPDGAETWSGGSLFATGVSIGAPPDAFSATGQVWGIRPWSPVELTARGLEPFQDLIAANVRHAGLLRIDHVLGLRRQFWVPDGASGADGAYVAFPERLLHAELSLASHRARCVIVGEDLGTLPEGLRERLDAAAILGTRVLLFERDGPGFRPPSAWPRTAVACAASHDLPPLAAWWTGDDIAERLALGLIDGGEAAEARGDRTREKAALLEALAAAGFHVPAEAAFEEGVAEALHRFLAATPALLALVQVEDLAGARATINVPGTDRERPNWRARLARPLDEIFADPAARRLLAAVGAGRLRSGQGPDGP